MKKRNLSRIIALLFLIHGIYSCEKETVLNEYYQVSQYDPDKSIVQINTTNIATGLETVFIDMITDSNERKDLCISLVDEARFFSDGSGYFFIYDLKGVNVAHPAQKELQGLDLYDYQDPKGAYVLRDMIALVEADGGSFYNYYWNNPNTGKQEPKTVYVTKIPGSNYFIGSGVYLIND